MNEQNDGEQDEYLLHDLISVLEPAATGTMDRFFRSSTRSRISLLNRSLQASFSRASRRSMPDIREPGISHNPTKILTEERTATVSAAFCEPNIMAPPDMPRPNGIINASDRPVVMAVSLLASSLRAADLMRKKNKTNPPR